MKPVILILNLCFVFNIFAQHKRPMTAEDLWNVKRVSGLTVSPDGKYGAFVVTEYSIKDNKGNSDLWVIDLATNKIKRLTTNVGSDHSPVWHPNSKTIAFISKREGDYPQLYHIDIDGGEASLITEMPLGISSPKYTPDGKRIIFASQILPEFEKDFDGFKKHVKEKKDGKMTAKVTENRLYRYWDNWLTDGYVTHLYSYNTDTKERFDLTKESTRMLSVSGGVDYDVSPDGQWLVLSANSTEPPYREVDSDIYLVKIGDSSWTNLTSSPTSDENGGFFSKDGKFLYYSQFPDPNHPAESALLVQMNLATKDKKILNEKLDITFSDFQETSDGKQMFMFADIKALSAIYSLNTASGKFESVLSDGSMNALNVTKEKLYFLKQNLSLPTEIFEYNLKTKKQTQLSFFNKTLMDSLSFGKVENLTFKGANNDDVQMFFIYPPDFDPNKKYPLVHMIHGGPHGTFGDEFHFRWNGQLFAADGYAVAMVNFHGSTSFGNDFTKSIVGAHGDKPFTDIMKATDYLLEKYSFLDSTRMAAAGGSYGGYMVNWIAGHTNRFKCLISHAGVYDLMAQFASDVTYERDQSYGGSPWEGKYDNINRYSPAYFAHNFSTPMLIIHGEKDYRVPVTQGLEIYGVLQGKGIPARLVYYPNENHWILQPQNSIYWYKEVHDWFKRFLK